jgi:hypothetical protein
MISASYPLQVALLADAKRIWEHTSTIVVSGDYFISFPCLHVLQPTVALWHLRADRRIALFLLAYLILLPIADRRARDALPSSLDSDASSGRAFGDFVRLTAA